MSDRSVGDLVSEIVHRYAWGSDTLEMKWDGDFELYLVKYGTDTAANPDLRVALVELLEGLKS